MMPRFSDRQERLLDVLFFILKILVFVIPLYALMLFQDVLIPLQHAVSSHVESVLLLLGSEVARDGFLFVADGFPFFVSVDCTGWKSMLFFIALVFAVPRTGMKKRLAGVAAGLAAIYLANLARILVMVHAYTALGPGVAGLLHDFFWQFGLIAVVLVSWVIWLILVKELEITFLRRLRKSIKFR